MKKRLTNLLFIALAAVTIVTTAFYFDANGSAGTALGTSYQLQDFENPMFPPMGWSITNSSGYNWVRTVVCSGYGQGTSAIKADFFDYQTGTFDLISQTIPASGAGDSVKFDHAYATYQTENDQLSIYTSSNNGSSWNLLITLNGGASGPLVTAPGTAQCFVPTSSQWATKQYALPTGTNKVKFSGVTAYGNNLYLDNIRIGAPYTTDVGANSIYDPKITMQPGSITPKATVKNYGSTTQSFQVTLTINPGGYTSTQSVSNLAAGSSQQVTFASNNFSSAGNYTMKAFTNLGSDENRANDTIYSSLLVTQSPRVAVFEFCTGTWCQWCPCGDHEAELLDQYYPQTVILAYHGPASGSDPFSFFSGNSILSSLGFSGYPSGLMDRKGIIGWGSFFTDGEYRYSSSPAADVKLNITNQNYNPGTRVLSVNLDATAQNTLTGQYKINYVITEDNIVYAQTGNGSCAGNSNYIHKWIVRNMVNGATGENVNTGTWNTNQTYSKTFNTTLDASWIPANCKIQIFVYKDMGTLNSSEIAQGIKAPITLTGVNNQNAGVPNEYSLNQNYPNPFNPTTNIKFGIPKGGNVSLKVFDITGRVVDVYYDGYMKAGYYNAEIDGTKLASGVYFYTLRTDNFTETKKMVLIK
jgi:hypothetical protein